MSKPDLEYANSDVVARAYELGLSNGKSDAFAEAADVLMATLDEWKIDAVQDLLRDFTLEVRDKLEARAKGEGQVACECGMHYGSKYCPIHEPGEGHE
jgi:hypothetical protein